MVARALKEREEPMRAEKVYKKAMKLLPVIIIVPIVISILIARAVIQGKSFKAPYIAILSH
jgi:hypothetical protein